MLGRFGKSIVQHEQISSRSRAVSTSMVAPLAKWVCKDILNADMKFKGTPSHGCFYNVRKQTKGV